MTHTYAILGSGAWGIAMAVYLQNLGHSVLLHCPRGETARLLTASRQRQALLPGIIIPAEIEITEAIDSVNEMDHWLIAVPTKFVRDLVKQINSHAISPKRGLISLSKGVEIGTFARPTEILAESLRCPIAVLSGPSHAEEVARGQPTSLVVASSDASYAAEVQDSLGSDRFRIYTSTDPVGVELAGAIKNVLGIAAGVGDGLGFGDNAKAALLTRGIVEMTRFGVAHGADTATFSGLAGLGDLMATCFSRHGRNRRAGERIAQGVPIAEILSGPQIVEGYFTAKSVHERSVVLGLDMPIVRSVYELLYEGKPPAQAVKDLMTRRQRHEPEA